MCRANALKLEKAVEPRFYCGYECPNDEEDALKALNEDLLDVLVELKHQGPWTDEVQPVAKMLPWAKRLKRDYKRLWSRFSDLLGERTPYICPDFAYQPAGTWSVTTMQQTRFIRAISEDPKSCQENQYIRLRELWFIG